ncbi:spore coat protein [Thermoflavimicrobium dichotomicum]|uniref:Coat F domain-containing protein n=1 Tax=Thermoflavimicrobium dichotomicum TaxID=46223 RepID=A0A1I3MJI6_9BACL|nr:spore coat protein [Thermoflavimicrobium dichotomicum]SFI97071.1 Coat F domain-containing protein [Thermoflavimicrobium dichotomicum]
MGLHVHEMVQDMLLLEKQIAETYQHTYLSTVNEGLRDYLQQSQIETNQLYSRIYNEMLQRGWVHTKVEARNAIESAIIYWEQYKEKHPELESK